MSAEFQAQLRPELPNSNCLMNRDNRALLVKWQAAANALGVAIVHGRIMNIIFLLNMAHHVQ